MKTKNHNATIEETSFPGYPLYPPSEDIYHTDKKAKDINPDDNSIIHPTIQKRGEWNEKDYSNDLIGDDLDVPGSDLDDMEDEENDYYSLGGDDHIDLDENNIDFPLG
ncbi:MAG: hypothetical protein WCO28_02990 [Bacteroidota bacterium]